MWKIKNALFIVFFIFFCTGCTKAQKLAQLSEFGELKGTVTPVVQATITLYQDETEIQQVSSDPSSGKFNFPELTPGSYSIIVNASNYQKMHQEIIIVPDQNNEVVIALIPNSSVKPPETPPPISPDPDTKKPPITSEHYAELITDLVIEKDSFDQGEKIKLTVTMTNPKNYPITIGFSSGIWRPFFTLTDTNSNEIWFSQHHLGFICLWGEATINPGETWTHTETWDGRDNYGNIISPGTYFIKAFGLDTYTKSTGKEIHVLQADLSVFTGKIRIEFKDDVPISEARTILENQGLSNLDFSLFADTILKYVHIVVPETEKTAIIQRLKQNSDIIDACPISDRG
ncbi:MAG: BsuPI-related putative proteinase inhibitor [bacterium]|nr:BsuPI-related putative proteinase inhibitor [bacterium]